MATVNELNAVSGGLDKLPAWQALHAEAGRVAGQRPGESSGAPDTSAGYSIEFPGIVLDYSRNLLTGSALGHLLELADARQLGAWREALFSGLPVNSTEGRAAMHMALRATPGDVFRVNGQDVMPAVVRERERMLDLASRLHSGEFRGHGGAPITDVVNIGIGGSDLGLVMISEALRPMLAPNIRLHFVSNIDGSELADTLARVEPGRTLFIVCSKSFSTLETQLNANAARDWFVGRVSREAVARHFVAVSVNGPAMDAFGISEELRFPIWDWVGGRYSLWSSIGLALAIGLGPDTFEQLLGGAEAMDRHFVEAAFPENMPAMLALTGIWNRNFLGMDNHAVLPYSRRLHRLPAYLQQLEMESNGKSVTRNGVRVSWDTAPVLWGEPGSNGQHSFFQLLHQGTVRASLDLILPADAGMDDEHRLHNQANALAQAEAFAQGYDGDAVRADLRERGLREEAVEALVPHKLHPGRRPCNLLLLRDLKPATLGSLIALYEHKVFVQGVVWGINSFDQWGVELGKQMAGDVAMRLGERDTEQLPAIASRLLEWSGPT